MNIRKVLLAVCAFFLGAEAGILGGAFFLGGYAGRFYASLAGGLWISITISLISLVLTLQGVFTLVWMLYAWENPEDAGKHKSPSEFAVPHFSFTALLPARHEEKVIAQTIRAIASLDYPEILKELLVLCREDDTRTIEEARRAIVDLPGRNIRLITFNDRPINKPHSLNIGLRYAKNEVITIFDAEDQPHKAIYRVADTVMVRDGVDVVQSGVQPMNFRTHWFSTLSVMEYFFWFKSGLNFFSRIFGVTPLGGNTVFIKKSLLEKIGGWDEKCLTEDADVGLRLVQAGAKIRVVYDELHVTREETPTNIPSFIKQRTRWDQGFLQILAKRGCRFLITKRQKFLANYILLSPELQVALILYVPFGLWISLTQKLPVVVSMLSFLPMYIVGLQIVVEMVGTYEFAKAYGLKYPFWMPIKILITFFPYQAMLTIASFRAMERFLFRQNKWEKTTHANAHREMPAALFLTTPYAQEFTK